MFLAVLWPRPTQKLNSKKHEQGKNIFRFGLVRRERPLIGVSILSSPFPLSLGDQPETSTCQPPPFIFQNPKQKGKSNKPTGTQQQNRRRGAAKKQTSSRKTRAEKHQHSSKNGMRRSSKTAGTQHESLQKVPAISPWPPAPPGGAAAGGGFGGEGRLDPAPLPSFALKNRYNHLRRGFR